MQLSDIDNIYRQVKDHMSIEDKISYCARVIYRTHQHLNRHGNSLSREAKSRSLQVLQNARQEMHQLLASGFIS